MHDKTINNALAQVWRNREPGWEFAWGALIARGAEIPPQRVRPRAPRFKRKELRRAILAALSDTPRDINEIVPCLCSKRPDIPPDVAKCRAVAALHVMRSKGEVRRAGRAWLLS